MTKKPCPHCGHSDYNRKPDSVCHDCLTKIRNWDEHVASALSKPDKVVVNLKECYHWYPMFYFGGRSHNSELDQLRKTLGETLPALAQECCSDVLPRSEWRAAGDTVPLFPRPRIEREDGTAFYYPCSDGSGGDYDAAKGVMTVRQLELLQTLWDACARFAHLAYVCGVEEGQDLLKQLSNGGMSVDDLQEQSIAIAKQVQSARQMHHAAKKQRKSKSTP